MPEASGLPYVQSGIACPHPTVGTSRNQRWCQEEQCCIHHSRNICTHGSANICVGNCDAYIALYKAKTAEVHYKNSLDGSHLCHECFPGIGVPRCVHLFGQSQRMLRSLRHLQLYEISQELFEH
uniref:Uncharacterized protein n=1 Tax=Cacopsylla melanoneura TaxID=428564 RepID=A0A8D8YE52_9HEMI